MLKELGISGGTFILGCIVLYFVIKWAVSSGMSETNKLLKKILSAQSAGGSEVSNMLSGRVGEVCRIHLSTDSEYYFTMGGEFNAKVVSAGAGWVELIDIQSKGSEKFSGKVTIHTADITLVEEVEDADENV